MQNSSFINSSFKRVVFSKLFHEQFAIYFTKQCYLALFFYAIKLSQTYLVDVLFVLCQSNPTAEHKQNYHKLSTISRTPTPYISTFFLTRIYNNNFHSGKPNMLTLPEKFFFINFYFYQTNYYEVTVGLLTLFPSMASFFFQQLAQNKGPSHGFDVGEKKDPKFTNNPSVGA